MENSYLCLNEIVYQYYMDDTFDKNRLIQHWIESSENDFKAMIDLYQTKNNNWALFMGHLVIEKLLKALYVKIKGDYPPMIHDLRRLCEKADINLACHSKFY